MVIIKTKHNDNMTTNCGTINLNMRKMTHFKQFLDSVTLTLTLSRYLEGSVIFSERQFNVQQIAKVRIKNL